MTTTPNLADPVQAVLDRLDGVKAESDGQWKARCPSHEDRVPSLSIGVGDNGCALVHCQAGCSIDEVLAAIDMTKAELFPKGTTPNGQKRERRNVPQRRKEPQHRKVQHAAYQTFELAVAAAERQTHGKQTAAWTYHRANGQGHFRIVRFELTDGKTFRPFHLSARGWVQADPPGQLSLYCLPELLSDDTGEAVNIFEGEGCADAARKLGLTATTSAHGCKSPKKSDWTPLAGRSVIVWPDHDANGAGQKYAQTVAGILTNLDPPASVKIVELPDLDEHGDIVDFIRDRRIDAKDDAAIRAEIEAIAERSPETEPPLAESISPEPNKSLTPSEIAALPQTDLGNSERLVARHGDDLRYSQALGWLCWDGRRWKRDDTGEAERRAKLTVRVMYKEAASIDDADKRQALAAWAKSSESSVRIRNMLDLAKSEGLIAVTPDQLDQGDFLLNVENGTIDLRSGKCRPHDRADLITKLAPVTHDPEATCPTFDRFLNETVRERTDLALYLQQFLGMCLSGDITEQILVIAYGAGSNGKNTLFDQYASMTGDYTTEAAPELLVNVKHRGHPTEIADLFGKRFVIASETERNEHLRVQFVKRLTGDAKLKARFMRQDFFEFRRTNKTILITNNKPVVAEQTHAIWRRLRLVPFDNVVADQDQDKTLPEKLWAESSGILLWLIRGCLSWQRDGLTTPPEVLLATNEYRAESNWLERFVEECLTLLPELWVSSAKLTDTHNDWCREVGLDGDLPAMREYLKFRGCATNKLHRTRGWQGVGIAHTTEVPE